MKTINISTVRLNLLACSRSLPVAKWLHFRASVRKGMVFSSRRGTPFSYLCWNPPMSFVQSSFIHFLNPVKSLLKTFYEITSNLADRKVYLSCYVFLSFFHILLDFTYVFS